MKCTDKVNQLMKTQKQLEVQIANLEKREAEGNKLLKEADCMWTCMESEYKKKLAESAKRQRTLLNSLKDIEGSANKWRKNMKDLELQLTNADKNLIDIKEKTSQKASDIKCMDKEIADFNKRVANHNKEVEAVQKTMENRKKACDKKMASIAADNAKYAALLKEEQRRKAELDATGKKHIKVARDELQKITKVLLQKKIENEELQVKKQALALDLDFMRHSYNQCQYKCMRKRLPIDNELQKVQDEIATYKSKCIRCHKLVDTVEIIKFCTDCPKCLENFDYNCDDDHCSVDDKMDCVCMEVKRRFLDNVFENMYTFLTKQVDTDAGKNVGDAILTCVREDRHGKLTSETRKILQDFILDILDKNFTNTIVGGAVKTRCEMDQDTYKQLMKCLKLIKKPCTQSCDKETPAKKDACERWGGTNECHCPQGPKKCSCSVRVPPVPDDPRTKKHKSEGKKDNEEDDDDEYFFTQDQDNIRQVIKMFDVKPYPTSKSACGTDCGAYDCCPPNRVGTDVTCCTTEPRGEEESSHLRKKMRAAPCVLGHEALGSVGKHEDLKSQMTCSHGVKHWSSDRSHHVNPANTGKLEEVQSTSKDNRYVISVIEKEIDGNEFAAHKQLEISSEPPMTANTHTELRHSYTNSCKNFLENKTSDDESMIKNRLQVSVKNERDPTIKDKNAVLLTTDSGHLLMQLDEQVLDTIDRKTKENPHLFISVQKTASGHSKIDLSKEERVASDFQRILVERTPSGNMCLKIKKKIIKSIDTDAILDLSKQKSFHKKEVSNLVEVLSCTQENAVSGNCQKNNFNDYEEEIENLYNQGCREVRLIVQGKNGSEKHITAEVARTLSKNFAFDVGKISTIEYITLALKETPVILNKTLSGTFKIKVNKADEKPNAIIRKTASGSIFLLPRKPGYILSHIHNKCQSITKYQSIEKMCPLKINGVDSKTIKPESPILLKETRPGNLETVVDKDFEKIYIDGVKNLNKNNCGLYCRFTPNSQIVKSKSGNNIEILKNPQLGFKRADTGSMSNFPVCFKHVSVDTSSKTSKDQSLKRKNWNHDVKNKSLSISDTNLLENINIKLQCDNQCLFDLSSAKLKKVSAGRFAILMDERSKSCLVDNLKNYLHNSSRSLIPIKITDQGDIIIVLNDNHAYKNLYGSLKVSASGNIYVLVNQNGSKTKTSVNDVEINTSEKYSDESFYLFSVLMKSKDQCLSTTCRGDPKKTCDESKCVCEQDKSFVQNLNKHEKKVIILHPSERTDQKRNYFTKQKNLNMTTCDYSSESILENLQPRNEDDVLKWNSLAYLAPVPQLPSFLGGITFKSHI